MAWDQDRGITAASVLTRESATRADDAKRKSWRVVDFGRPSFSYNSRDLEATITLKTTENSKDDAPTFPSKPSRAIYKLKTTYHGNALSEVKTKP